MMKKVVSAMYVAVVVCSVAVVMVAGAGGGGGKGGGEDEGTTLAVFSGVHGLNRASVCVLNVRPVRRCEAALATARWAVVRASCLLGATATSLRLVRDSDGLSCADVEIDPNMWRVNHVSWLVRPSLRQDLVLLPLRQPYFGIDTYVNTSYVDHFLKEWEPWFQHNQQEQPGLSFGHKHVLLSTPMRMLVTTVLLPMLSFIALFMFVVFCTGPRDPIPYQAIEETETEKTDSLSV